MIIEFVNPVDAKPIIFIHFKLGENSIKHINSIAKSLSEIYTNHVVMKVPDGAPCPNNKLPKIGVFNKNNTALSAAIKKICGHGKPGSYIPLETNEMKAITEAQANNELVYF